MPDPALYAAMLRVCEEDAKAERALALLSEMETRGLEPDGEVYSVVVSLAQPLRAHAGQGTFAAREALRQPPSSGSCSWNVTTLTLLASAMVTCSARRLPASPTNVSLFRYRRKCVAVTEEKFFDEALFNTALFDKALIDGETSAESKPINLGSESNWS